MPFAFTIYLLLIWFSGYANKRICQLKQQVIRDQWQTIEIEKTVDQIINKQQDQNKHLQKDMLLSVGALFFIVLSIHLAKLPLCLIQNNLIHFLSQYILLHNSLHIPFVSNPQNQKIPHLQDQITILLLVH